MKIILLIMIGFSLGLANVVLDKKTGLLWQDNSAAKSVKRDWSGAKKYCRDLKLAGHSDWFLPTYEQLQTITDKSRYNPAIDKKFKNIVSSDYWSSSSYVSGSNGAWGVCFKDGNSDYNGKTDNRYVRCARAGQSDTLNFDKLVYTLISQELKSISKPTKELKLQRGEFETTKEFQLRVQETKQEQREAVRAYKKRYAKAKKDAQAKAIKKALEMTWGKPLLSHLKYDADNGYFIADISFEKKKDFRKKVAIKVERKDARAFKKEFSSLKPEAVFDYDGKSVKLQDIRVPYKHKRYAALFTDLNINDTRVAVNLKNDYNIDSSISSSVSVAQNSVKSFDASRLVNYHELDKLLKKSKAVKKDNTKWLFVVGIEKYDYTDNISYARRSAMMFKKVMMKKLGVKESHAFTMLDEKASQARIKTNLKKMLRRVKSGDTIYFYYNGHGVPIPSLKNEPYMLASDSEPDYIADEKFFSLQNIYSKLSDSKASKVVAVIDSCFSGVTDGKAVLKGVAATKMVAKSVKFDKHKMVVMTAGKGNQYSNGYNKKGYRLFSFYVMQNILEGDREIKKLYRDTKSETYETSLEEYGDVRAQEPQIEGNFRMRL